MKILTLFFSLTLASAPLLSQTSTESRAKLAKTAGNLRILSGKASVIDARTLKVDGKNVRLEWIEPLPVYKPTTKRYVQEETEAKAELAGAWSTVKKYGRCCRGVDSDTQTLYRRGLVHPYRGVNLLLPDVGLVDTLVVI